MQCTALEEQHTSKRTTTMMNHWIIEKCLIFLKQGGLPNIQENKQKGKTGRKTAVQIFQLRVVMQGQDCMHCFTVDLPESDILAHPHSYLLPASMHQKRVNTSRRSSSFNSKSKWNRHIVAYIFECSKENLKHWSCCRWGRAS